MTVPINQSPEVALDVDPAARRWRTVANALTVGRTALAGIVFANVVTGAEIMPEVMESLHIPIMEMGSFALAGAGVVFGVMDKLDGMAARKAGERGLHPTEHDMKRDPFHDKLYAYMAMSTVAFMVAAEAIATKDYKKMGYAAGIVANMGVIGLRDVKMTKSRNNVVEGVAPEAIRINKWKTGVQNVAHALVMSPVPTWVSAPAYGAVSGMAWLGYKVADRVYKGERYPGIVEATRRVMSRKELVRAA